jgi:hypothetical protein
MNGLVRLRPDGIPDTTIRVTPTLNGHVYDFEVLPDARSMIAGAFTSVGAVHRNGIARLNSDGSLDPTFDAGIGANDIVRAVAFQPGGEVVIAGQFTDVNGAPCKYRNPARSAKAGRRWPSDRSPRLPSGWRDAGFSHSGRNPFVEGFWRRVDVLTATP